MDDHRVRVIFWSKVAVAATLLTLIIVVSFIPGVRNKSDSKQLVHGNIQIGQQKTEAEQEKGNWPLQREVGQAVKDKVPERPNISDNEVISDVLTDLSDDELLQMATIFKTDLFINESVQ